MVKIYSKRDDLRDSREFAYGEIWQLRDELIRLLPTDRVQGSRSTYFSRTVVIVQNCLENNDNESLIIEVAREKQDIAAVKLSLLGIDLDNME